MMYIDCPTPGGPEALRLSQGPIPIPSAGQVLIRVVAAGVNRPDIAGRQGRYPPPPGASPILGLEVSGYIESCGPEVTEWKPGDRVCALTPGGGYAEYCVAPASHCLSIPEGLDLETGAGIPENFFTVWTNVIDRGRLRSGESFLVHGGSSGIGLTAIQLAKQIGARVFTTVGSERKREACLALGAEAAVLYKTQDFVEEIKNLTDGKGAHLILDMIGGEYFQKNLALLQQEGRLVQIAFQKGAEVFLNLTQIMAKRLTITGSTLRPRSIADKALIAQALKNRVWPWLESGKVKVNIDRIYPLAEAADAHRYMETSEHIGKILLRVR